MASSSEQSNPALILISPEQSKCVESLVLLKSLLENLISACPSTAGKTRSLYLSQGRLGIDTLVTFWRNGTYNLDVQLYCGIVSALCF